MFGTETLRELQASISRLKLLGCTSAQVKSQSQSSDTWVMGGLLKTSCQYICTEVILGKYIQII